MGLVGVEATLAVAMRGFLDAVANKASDEEGVSWWWRCEGKDLISDKDGG